MKAAISLRFVLCNLSISIALAVPLSGVAQDRVEQLRQCLQDFDGIAVRLPYRPAIHVRSCASPTVSFDAGEKLPVGQRRLELIGELTLESDADQLPSGENRAAIQNAVYVHFDALFRQRGYQRIAVEHGDAQTRPDPDTQRALRRVAPLSKDESERQRQQIAQLPPVPYVNLARYVRSDVGRDVVLTYRCQYANTWIVLIEGLPSDSTAQGVSR